MDDFGHEHKVLAQQLKIWGDRYGCILENKGGSMPSHHKAFVVTSQYTLEDIFWQDKPTLDALKRRYKQIHITEPGHARIYRRTDDFAAAGTFFKPKGSQSE